MKKVVLVPIILILLPITVFVLAGTPLILGVVKDKIEAAVSENLGMPLTIGSLSGNLFFSLGARDIESHELGRVDGISIVYNPFALLSRRIDIRSVHIEGIDLDINELIEAIRNRPRKSDSLPSGSSPIGIQIDEYSIAGGGLALKIGETPLSVHFSAQGLMTKDFFVVDSLLLRSERSTAFLKGRIPLRKAGELDAVFDIALGIEDLGFGDFVGRVVTKGTIHGAFEAMMIYAENHLDIRQRDNEIKGVVGLNWHLPDFADLDLEAKLRLTAAALRKGMEERDIWEIKASVKRMRMAAGISSRYGEMQLTGILKGEVSRPEFDGSVSGRFDYYGFNPSFNGLVYYGGDVLTLSRFNLSSRRVSLDFKLRYDHGSEKISDTRLALHCSDLGVINSLLETPEEISGKLWCDMVVSGSAQDPVVSADVRLADAMAFGEVITEARFYASMKSNVVRLDSSTIGSARGFVATEGLWDMTKEDFALGIVADALDFSIPGVYGADTVMVGGTVGLHMNFSGTVHNPQGEGEMTFNDVVYDTLHIGNYSLEFNFADTTLQVSLADDENTLTLTAEAFLYGDFPFIATAEIRHFVVDRFASQAAGHLTADLRAEGSFSDLRRMSAALQIDTVDLTYDNNRLHNVEPVFIDLNEGIVSFHRFTLGIAGQTIQLEGTIPVDFETANMDISGKSSDMQLAEIVSFLPGGPPIAGRVNFDVRIQGKPRQLDIDGDLMLANANYVIDNVSFDSVSGRFLFKNGLVTCRMLSGKINEGRFEVSGIADLSRGLLDTISVEMKLNRIDYANKDFGRVLVDADFQADGRRDSLWINGEIVVVEGVYDAPMKLQRIVGILTAANRPVPQQPELSKRIHCDIGITVLDSVIVANNVANLSAKADLQVKGYLARLNAYGTIVSTGEGTIQYLGKRFDITSAIIQFDDPYKIDPVIDLAATSTIAAADGDYVISLLLSGTVTTWQLELSSNPPLPQQDIVSLLLIGQRRPGGVGSTVKEIDLKGKAKDYALDAVRYGIEKSGERLLGLDRFTITGELDDPSSVTIGIEKSITKGFTLLYTTGIESWELYQIGASYDITDHISVFTLYDQENLNTSVDLDFHFNIK
ncbi:MAG: translocation/assembly module TamB domain-containing protein [candidate division WOR-3 bacterium]|nr:MAG: translocation/assembly module TamB domain-containing protein [candidate division WOR-3 bacterium]